MIKIGCCGLASQDMDRIIKEKFNGTVESYPLQDMVAAKAIKTGKLDYYIGSCMSGAGGALAMAIAILGFDKCLTVSTAGAAPSSAEIKEKVLASAAVAFGINAAHADTVIPVLVSTLLEKQEKST